MGTERAGNPDTERERETEREGGRGSEWKPQRTETRQTSHQGTEVMKGEGPGAACPPQLPLEPWACAARGSSLPRPPSPQPHPRLTRQWPQGRLPLLGAGVPQASSPSARSSPSVAKDGGASGHDRAGHPCPLLWASPGPPCTSGEGRQVVAPSSGRSNSMGPRVARRWRAITRCCSKLQWFSRDRMTG